MTTHEDASNIRLVCFDLGGVVIRICRTWTEGCRAAGIDVRDERQRAAARDRRHELIVQYQTGRIDGPTFARRVSDAIGGLYSPDEIMAVHHAWMLGSYEGVDRLIDDLHARDRATAALSNTNAEHWEKIVTYPAVMRMHHRLASHVLGLHKPDPAMYERAASHFGVPADSIVFFDDLPENVAAARDCGWRAFEVDPHGDTASQMRTVLEQLGVLEPVT